jgi:hypothetical protein
MNPWDTPIKEATSQLGGSGVNDAEARRKKIAELTAQINTIQNKIQSIPKISVAGGLPQQAPPDPFDLQELQRLKEERDRLNY